MRILVVGSGGREHTIIRKLKESPKVDKIYAAPGNGGIAKDAECLPRLVYHAADKTVWDFRFVSIDIAVNDVNNKRQQDIQ